LKFTEISREIGKRWKEIDDDDKAPYVEKAEKDALRHKREMADYVPAEGTEPAKVAKSEGGLEEKKVFVGGMPYETTEDELREFFKECGTIDLLELVKGTAFVTFSTAAEASAAAALDGATMGSRWLKIVLASAQTPKRVPAKKAKKTPSEMKGEAEKSMTGSSGAESSLSSSSLSSFLSSSFSFLSSLIFS
jgi:RNA recognition motif-containing protein